MTTHDLATAPTLTSQTQVDALIWDRVPHPSWQEELDRITPASNSEHKARAIIWWEPGDEWEPIQRWIIYQMLPKKAIPPHILKELQGPHPRSTGSYSKALGCWKNGCAPNITRTAWEIFQKFGGWAQPFWILQGENGGHRYKLFPWEKVLLHLATGRKDTAAPGDLPYCEPDQRTWASLWDAKHRSEEAAKVAMLATKYRGELDGEDVQMVDKAAREFVKSWGESVSQHADEFAWALRKNPSMARADAVDADYDADEEDLIRELRHEWTGNVPKLDI